MISIDKAADTFPLWVHAINNDRESIKAKPYGVPVTIPQYIPLSLLTLSGSLIPIWTTVKGSSPDL